VSDAQWYPLYDLYAASQDGKPSTSVSLHYRVNLSQSTGEDWTNAKLILSTSETDVLNAGVPKSDNLVIEPKQPPPPPPSKRRKVSSVMWKQTARRSTSTTARFMDTKAEVSEDEEDDDEDDDMDLDFVDFVDALPEMSEGGAVISKTPMGVNYTVDELTTIRSDGESHKVLVATVPLEAVISHITTPRKSPLAYLQVCSPLVPIHNLTYHTWAYSVR